MQQQLNQLESLAIKLYNSQDPNERRQAEEALKISNPSPEALAQCHFILENSLSPYALLLAISSLNKLFTEHWSAFAPQQHLESKTCVMRFIATRGDKTQNYVVLTAMQLVSRITKLGWFEEGQSTICDDVRTFLTAANPTFKVLGLLIYANLVSEMSILQTGVHMSFSQHNRTASKFRDSSLLNIFDTALAALRECMSSSSTNSELMIASMKLALQCLSFNFIGAVADESGDDAGTVQVPTQWRTHFENQEFIGMWFQLYSVCTLPLSSMALECLSQIASVRKSLFSSEAERVKFLARLMQGVKQILESRLGLNEQENHHALCRLLSRLKSNYQLTQLGAAEGWQQWITLVYQFTITSLEGWRWSPNSVHYLMNFWSRMVTSLNYITSGNNPSCILKFAPKVTEAFIKTRLDSVQVALEVPEDDPLNSEDHMTEQLEFVPSMGRCDYQETSTFILTLVDSMTTLLSQRNQQGLQFASGERETKIILGQFSWMVYIIGALIGGRMAVASSDECDVIDGSLACRCFHLMRFIDARTITLPETTRSDQNSSDAKLELAFLSFLQSFRRMYIGDSAISASKAFNKMGELLNLSTPNAVLQLVIAKITHNLKWWKNNVTVIDKTLLLFNELATGYSSGRLVSRLEIVGQILVHHTDEAFSFAFDKNGNRQRRTIYSILGRVLFSDEHREDFEAFIKPFETKLDGLLAQQTAEALRQPQCRQIAISVCRELSGLFSSVTTSASYLTLFEWFYPKYAPLLFSRLAEVFSSDIYVMRPLMELICELMHNKSNRIRFDYSSANGILLFKDCCSRVIVAYGSRLSTQTITQGQDIYHDKYKGVILILESLTHALGGEYVCFGVFGLYNDSCLTDALNVTFNISLGMIPVQEILSYGKLAKAFYTFIDVLCSSQVSIVCALDSVLIGKLFSAMDVGLKSSDVTINTLCCTTIDFIFTWYLSIRKRASAVVSATAASAITTTVTNSSNGTTQIMQVLQSPRSSIVSQNFERNVAIQPELVTNLIADLLKIVLFTDCQFLYTIARPLHVLIVAAPQLFDTVRTGITNSQPSQAQRERLSEAFQKLSQETPLKLDPKSREKFTQSLVVFSHSSKTFISPLLY